MNWLQIVKEYLHRHEIDGPSGHIQWKGTDVCMDIYCECGYHSHIDDDFVYMVRCPKCKAVYYVSPHVHLDRIDVVDEPDSARIKEADL